MKWGKKQLLRLERSRRHGDAAKNTLRPIWALLLWDAGWRERDATSWSSSARPSPTCRDKDSALGPTSPGLAFWKRRDTGASCHLFWVRWADSALCCSILPSFLDIFPGELRDQARTSIDCWHCLWSSPSVSTTIFNYFQFSIFNFQFTKSGWIVKMFGNSPVISPPMLKEKLPRWCGWGLKVPAHPLPSRNRNWIRWNLWPNVRPSSGAAESKSWPGRPMRGSLPVGFSPRNTAHHLLRAQFE